MAVCSSADAQSALLCQLCDTDNGVQWRCVTCGENMCNSCKSVHSRAKISKHHKVQRYEEVSCDKYQGKYVDEILRHCSVHSKEPFQMVCTQCQIMVCFTCINGPHKKHSFSNIPDDVAEQRQELFQRINEAEKQLNTCISNRKALQNSLKQYEKETTKTVEKIRERNKELITMIDTETDDMIYVVQQKEKQDKLLLKNRANFLDKTITTLDDALLKSTEKILSGEIVGMSTCLQGSKLPFQCLTVPIGTHPPEYLTRETDKDCIKAMLGDVLFCDENRLTSLRCGVDKVSKFKVSGTENFICVADEEHVWLQKHGQPDLTLANKNGNVVKIIKTDFSVFGIAVTESGYLIVSVYAGHHVKKLADDDNFINLYNASPFMTCGVCVTSDSDILLCLYDKIQSKIVRLSQNGELLQTIQPYWENKTTPLLNAPVALEMLENGTICVKDYDHKSKITSVVFVDKLGRGLFRYEGSAHHCAKKTIDPGKVIKGPSGTVLISDTANNSIHLLDENGNFLYYLMTEQDGLDRPKGIALSASGHLWICNTGRSEILIVKMN